VHQALGSFCQLTMSHVDSLVNVIPALKYLPPWFPGAQWKRDALEWRSQKDIMVNETFNWTKQQVVS
jgi:hypothetical protein